jgi:hypothetical protein
MWGFDGLDPRVFVENKFWTGLTDNQPVSYIEQLSAFTQPTVLLVVVPAAREQTIWRELLSRQEAQNNCGSLRLCHRGGHAATC